MIILTTGMVEQVTILIGCSSLYLGHVSDIIRDELGMAAGLFLRRIGVLRISLQIFCRLEFRC